MALKLRNLALPKKRTVFLFLLYAAVVVTAGMAGYRVFAVHQAMGRLQDTSFGQFEGAPDARKTIVEFFDYRCGYCRETAPVLKEVMARHPDVKIIYRHYPVFGTSSLVEAEVALAAGMHGKFQEAHRYLIGRGEEPVTDREISALIQSLGLDEAKFRVDMKDQGMGYLLLETLDIVELFNIRSTPAFMIGDILYTLDQGKPDADTFDRLLAEAYGE